jgi:hypothetical protein
MVWFSFPAVWTDEIAPAIAFAMRTGPQHRHGKMRQESDQQMWGNISEDQPEAPGTTDITGPTVRLSFQTEFSPIGISPIGGSEFSLK